MSKASALILKFQHAYGGHREPANVNTRMNLESVQGELMAYKEEDDVPIYVPDALTPPLQKEESNTIVIDIPDESSSSTALPTESIPNSTFDATVTPGIEIKSEAPPITITPPLHPAVDSSNKEQGIPEPAVMEYTSGYKDPETNITSPATAERFTKPQQDAPLEPEVVTSTTDTVPDEKPVIHTVVITKSPIIALSITNTSDEPTSVTLFDGEKNATALNYGNPSNIEIKSILKNYNVTYQQILSNTTFAPIICGYIRLISKNISQTEQDYTFSSSKNKDGESVYELLPASARFTPFQQDPSIIDYIYPLVINGKTDVRFNIFGKTKLEMYIYADFVREDTDPSITISSNPYTGRTLAPDVCTSTTDTVPEDNTITIPGDSITVTNTEIPVTNTTIPAADALITPTGEQLDTPISGEDKELVVETDKSPVESTQPENVTTGTTTPAPETTPTTPASEK